jgi:hypothetical protein
MSMDCQEVVAQLPALQDGELATGVAQEVRAHLMGCEECRRVSAGLETVERMLSAQADWVAPSNGIAAAAIRAAAPQGRRTLRFIPALAAAAALLALATVAALRFIHQQPPQPQPVAYVEGPRVVVERPAAVVAAPLQVTAVAPSATGVASEDLSTYQLNAAAGPVGRAFVVCDGQVRPYEGAAAVTMDRTVSGPSALRVDAFPRAHTVRHPASRRM